jgi:hypothetical protein
MPLMPIQTVNGPLEYEVSSGFAYRFARYLILARVAESEEFRSGQSFHLLPLIRSITNEYLTQEEQQATYARRNGQMESVFDAIRWYVPYVGRETEVVERVQPGWYRMPTGVPAAENGDDGIDEEIAEEAGPAIEGWIYAFTFPELIKDGSFPIKIGMTIRDVEERVADQCRGSAIFSPPIILKAWEVRKVSLTERTVQNLLKLSGQWKSEAPGAEWFITTLAEIERVMGIVQNETR